MDNKLLPIGTVVLLKDYKKKVMIFGVKQTVKDNEVFDYIGVPYPEGNIGIKYHIFFNNNQIESIYFKGCADDDYEKFNRNLIDFYNKKVTAE